VRAPVPCFVTATLVIERKSTDDAPDSDAVENAAATAVNNVGFTGRVVCADVAAAVQAVLTESNVVKSVTLDGIIRLPDSTTTIVGPSTDILAITSAPADLVSARTIGFFLEPSDVTVTLTTVTIPPV